MIIFIVLFGVFSKCAFDMFYADEYNFIYVFEYIRKNSKLSKPQKLSTKYFGISINFF